VGDRQADPPAVRPRPGRCVAVLRVRRPRGRPDARRGGVGDVPAGPRPRGRRRKLRKGGGVARQGPWALTGICDVAVLPCRGTLCGHGRKFDAWSSSGRVAISPTPPHLRGLSCVSVGHGTGSIRGCIPICRCRRDRGRTAFESAVFPPQPEPHIYLSSCPGGRCGLPGGTQPTCRTLSLWCRIANGTAVPSCAPSSTASTKVSSRSFSTLPSRAFSP